MFKQLAIIRRLLHAARVLGAHGVLPPQDWEPLLPPQAKSLKWLFRPKAALQSGRTGERLAQALTKLGPSYIKAGQFLATRPDVIGQDIASDLSKLQDQLPPFPVRVAEEILERELGRDKCASFDQLSPAVAAASIAQVHKVTLKSITSGTRLLAIKIIRPGVEQEFSRELEAFAWLAARIENLSPETQRLRPTELVETLKRSVVLELDFRLEAAAADELAQNTINDAGFKVPKVIWDLTTRNVLTTEWVNATSLKDLGALKDKKINLSDLAKTIIQSFLRQALRDGYFHADMHPGNLFVDDQGSLIAVDFGIMGRLDHDSRRFMAETLAGFIAQDYRRVAEAHLKAGIVPAKHSVEDFAQALRAIGEPIFGKIAADMSMANLLNQLFEVTKLFDMRMQPQLALLQKTMVVVEGVARQLDPKLSIWDAAKPVVEQWAIDTIGPQARLREAGEGLGAALQAVSALPKTMRLVEQVATTLQTQGLKIDTTSMQSQNQNHTPAHTLSRLLLAALVGAAIAWFILS